MPSRRSCWIRVAWKPSMRSGGRRAIFRRSLHRCWRNQSAACSKRLLVSEFTVLTRLLARIAAGHYSTRDFSADSLRQALELYVMHFPVYRTYMTAAGPSPTDRELINRTIGKVRTSWFGADEGIFDFLRDALTLDLTKADRVAPGEAAHSPLRIESPAVHRADDGQIAGRHRLLPLPSIAGAQ